MTFVKICGITRGEDARRAAVLGADAVGFVFVRSSPRNIEPREARAIARDLRVMTVGVFEDAPLDDVKRTMDETELQVAQLHGRETLAYCRALARPFIKAFRARPAPMEGALALLGDGAETWDALPSPAILAGGLSVANVAAIVRAREPFGVDVARGVESGPGIKDTEKMRRFIGAVRESCS